MSKLTDEERIGFLRGYAHGIGYTPGQTFNEASVTMGSGRDFDIYTMGEVMSMIEELCHAFVLGGDLTPCQKNCLHQLRKSGIMQAYTTLLQYEESLEEN